MAPGRAGAPLATLCPLWAPVGGIFGESGPSEWAAGRHPRLPVPCDQPRSAAPHRGLAPACPPPRLPRPC